MINENKNLRGVIFSHGRSPLWAGGRDSRANLKK